MEGMTTTGGESNSGSGQHQQKNPGRGRRNRGRRKNPNLADENDPSGVRSNDAARDVESSGRGSKPKPVRRNKKPQGIPTTEASGHPPSENQDKKSTPVQKPAGTRRHTNKTKHDSGRIDYPRHWDLKDCLTRYNDKDPNIIRGKLRVLPTRDGASFCSCDRGSQAHDVLIQGPLERNRALDGDQVFVELIPLEEENESLEQPDNENQITKPLTSLATDFDESGDKVEELWWQDDEVQVSLWDPLIPVQRIQGIPKPASGNGGMLTQRQGRVVCIVPPRDFGSEINPTQNPPAAVSRRIVGTLKRLQNGTSLLTSANKSLPQFLVSKQDNEKFKDSPPDALYSAKYMGNWQPNCKWPPCQDLVQFGQCFSVEDETTALLIDNQVDHGEFPAAVLEECQRVVASGEYTNGTESGWRPTQSMYTGRRDLRHKRIFTIDPTTAKDLDDALHIEELENGEIELGVHIADVSHFIAPNTEIDLEAQRRCTTVYLVDRVLPMLPRPLCEIACSLNENVERLAFSCVWRMKKDGSLVKGHEVWYGRTVIKSCARLDYATAQNIIDMKVATGENEVSEEFWPTSRQPTGKHTIEEVAADVRLMHQVAMARRQLRFRNGAIALNGVKLTFQLDSDRETPLLCEPYPIRDSNRLVEEYMLLANYLVAQRLISHAGGKALLRNHVPPLFEGLEKVAEMAKQAIGFHIDVTSSESLQRSLNRLGRECSDELVLKCITETLKMPMQAAEYVAAGSIPDSAWSHFALNIPYYTHFTSPIRRYADVLVHRLLQTTIDGQQAVDNFVLSERDIQVLCERCNEKKEGSRKAQDRSDIVFLALYLRRSPMKSQLGVVLSVGEKAFTVFVPSLGISTMLFLEEHTGWMKYEAQQANNVTGRRIRLERISRHNNENWKELMITNFVKIRVTCKCHDKPPISVKLELEGPWTES